MSSAEQFVDWNKAKSKKAKKLGAEKAINTNMDKCVESLKMKKI